MHKVSNIAWQREIMKHSIWIAMIVILLVAAPALAADIEGIYDCSGVNPGGGTYKGTVSIIQNGENYTVTWHIGAQTYLGVGLLQGDSFAVGYSDAGKSWFGVVVYKVQDRKLSGDWSMYGGGKNGTETLTCRK